MMTKTGINSTRLEKQAPLEAEALASSVILSCGECGKTFEKSCTDRAACEVGPNLCPHCGAELDRR